MKTLSEILICSFLSMLAGAAILGGVTEGAIGFLGAPVLILFGWFYFPVVVGLQVIARGVWPTFAKIRFGQIWFVVTGVAIATGLFEFIGIGESGKEPLDSIGYALGSAMGAVGSCVWIVRRNDPAWKGS